LAAALGESASAFAQCRRFSGPDLAASYLFLIVNVFRLPEGLRTERPLIQLRNRVIALMRPPPDIGWPGAT
jgi:hypothetical protein